MTTVEKLQATRQLKSLMLQNKRFISLKSKYDAGEVSSLMHKRPTFQSGIASLFTFNHTARFSDYLRGNDLEDLRNDWMSIGNDLRKATRQVLKSL